MRRATPQPVGRCHREGETVAEKRQQWTRLGHLVLLIIALGLLVLVIIFGVMGCQVGPRLQGSILDECDHPTPADRDWCLSTQVPSII